MTRASTWCLVGFVLLSILTGSTSLNTVLRGHAGIEGGPVFTTNSSTSSALSGVWSPIQFGGGPYPSPRQGHSSTVVGNRVFIYGGTRGLHSEDALRELWILSTNSMTWSAVHPTSSRTYPPGLVGHSATLFTPPATKTQPIPTASIFVVAGLSYCGSASCGGTRSTWHNDVWVLNTLTVQWQRAKIEEPNPDTGSVAFAPRQGHTATLFGTKLLVFGGFADEDSEVNSDTRVFQLDLSSWGNGTTKLRWTALDIAGGGPQFRTRNFALQLDNKYVAWYNSRQSAVPGQSNVEVDSLDLSGVVSDKPSWKHQSFKQTTWIATDGAASSVLNSTATVAFGGCSGRMCNADLQLLHKLQGTTTSQWTWTRLSTQGATSTAYPRGRRGHSLSLVPILPSDYVNGGTNRSAFKLLLFGGCNEAGICVGGDSMVALYVTAKPSDFIDKCNQVQCHQRGGKCVKGRCEVTATGSIKALVNSEAGASVSAKNKSSTMASHVSFVVDVSCPSNCSGHGVCNSTTGRCACSRGRGEVRPSAPSFLQITLEGSEFPGNQRRPVYFGPSCSNIAQATKEVTVAGSGQRLTVPINDPRVERVLAVDFAGKDVEVDVPLAGPLLIFIPVLESVLETESKTAAAVAAAIAASGHSSKETAAAAANAIRVSSSQSTNSATATSFVEVAKLAQPGSQPLPNKSTVHIKLQAYEGQGVIVDPTSNSKRNLRRLMMHSPLSSKGHFAHEVGGGERTTFAGVKFSLISERLQREARDALELATRNIARGAVPAPVARTPPKGGSNATFSILIPSTGEVISDVAIEWQYVHPPPRPMAALSEGFARIADWLASLGKNASEAARSMELAASQRSLAMQQDLKLRTMLLEGQAKLVSASGQALHIGRRYPNGTEFVVLQNAFTPEPLPLRHPSCNCHGHGTCSTEGVCSCYKGWTGASCSSASCPSNCTSPANGECVRVGEGSAPETCRCHFGYSGIACNVSTGCGDLGRTCGPHADCVPHRALLQPNPSDAVRQLHQNLKPTLLAPPSPHKSHATAAQSVGAHPDLPLAVPEQRANKIVAQAKVLAQTSLTSAFYQRTLFSCDCHAGWAGPYCQVEACPNNCTSPEHGTCMVRKRRLQCVCNDNFSGRDCAQYLACEGDGKCSNHGVCENGNCNCDAGWTGVTCAQRSTCEGDRHCSGHGSCLRGVCACDPDYSGSACEIAKPCLHNCSGNGVCDGGVCACLPGFLGLDCSLRDIEYCPNGCNGRGDCFNGQCYCHPGFTGVNCETTLQCPSNVTATDTPCSGHGVCQYGRCYCDPAFYGKSCSQRKAPVAAATVSSCKSASAGALCSAHGVCVDAKCHCFDGYKGDSCELAHVCEPDCGAQGVCLFGTCQCKPGWRGPSCKEEAHRDCTLRKPLVIHGLPERCSGHGRCDVDSGLCECSPGWLGDACGEPADRVQTNASIVKATASSTTVSGVARADSDLRCVHGECLTTSPNVASEAEIPGSSSEVYCSCEPGWHGPECNLRSTCHANCSGHGLCHLGTCFCDPGFEGGSCHVQRECPVPCGFGICVYGRCACIDGFEGKDCRTPSKQRDSPQLPLPSSLSSSRTAVGGVSVTNPALRINGLRPTRDLRASTSFCPKGRRDNQTAPSAPCSGNGNCSMGECSCFRGWYGRACDQATASGPCPNRCSGRGICDHVGFSIVARRCSVTRR